MSDVGEQRPVVTDRDYAELATFRRSLRRFLHFSEVAAREAGITPGQYQLMIIIRGTPGCQPTIGELADALLLRHHSVVELVDRAEADGLVHRVADPGDGRLQRIGLTPAGRRLVRSLAAAHKEELTRWRRQGSP